jgi:hypothetical protein
MSVYVGNTWDFSMYHKVGLVDFAEVQWPFKVPGAAYS